MTGEHVKIHIISTVLTAVIFFGISPAFPTSTDRIDGLRTLKDLVARGLEQNQELQSLRYKISSLKQKVKSAGALNDPRIGIGLANVPTDTYDLDQEPMTQKQFFISQKFPWFGKLKLKSRRALLEAQKQEYILKAREIELVRKISLTYFDFGFLTRSLEINRRTMQMMNKILRVAETRYASGRGLQFDVLQAQVELSKLLEEKTRIKSRLRAAENRLKELAGLPIEVAIVPPGPMEPVTQVFVLEELTATALQSNPRLQVLQADIDLARIGIELAKKDYMPDMDVRLSYGQREEDPEGNERADFVTGTLTMNIPAWKRSRQDKNLAAAKHLLSARKKSLAYHKNSLPLRVDDLVTRIRDTRENYRLYVKGLMLQARQWALSSVSAYEVGKVEFNTMINAQIRMLRFENQAEQYLFQVHKYRAELEELLGQEVRNNRT